MFIFTVVATLDTHATIHRWLVYTVVFCIESITIYDVPIVTLHNFGQTIL